MRRLEDIANLKPEILTEYPPQMLMEKIDRAFPEARKPGVIFTYGEKIYNPSLVKLTHELLGHELVHVLQQREQGPDHWWDVYIHNPAFRIAEELEAHQMEYQVMQLVSKYSRPFRRLAARSMAKRLSGPLYGRRISFNDALKGIKERYQSEGPDRSNESSSQFSTASSDTSTGESLGDRCS